MALAAAVRELRGWLLSACPVGKAGKGRCPGSRTAICGAALPMSSTGISIGGMGIGSGMALSAGIAATRGMGATAALVILIARTSGNGAGNACSCGRLGLRSCVLAVGIVSSGRGGGN